MPKIIANKIYSTLAPNKEETIVSFTTKNNYLANLFVKDLEGFNEIMIEGKEFKKNRSISQNNMLWGIISKISDVLNGNHSKTETETIYKLILKEAQVKTVYVATVPEAKNILEQNFRIVEEVERKIDTQKATLQTYRCYPGSSTFNTKEMGQLIDIALDYAIKSGVDPADLEALKIGYGIE